MSAQEDRAYRDRPEMARESNERIAERAERLRFLSRVPMLCECSDGACTEFVLIGLDDYRRARRDGGFLTAPGHRVDFA
jgi:hypothetical protein